MLKRIEYPIRLHVYLAKCGFGSRRFCESLISAGRVLVNNRTVREPGIKVTEEDVVYVDSILAEPVLKMYYYALNKPKGYVCTNFDPHETAYARDLINTDEKDLLFNVGRLDKDSSGLIFFTNDGDFANKITHPSVMIEKEYIVKTTQPLLERDLYSAYKGDIKPYKIKSFRLLTKNTASIVLTEGKNREIRNIMSLMGYDVKSLTRIRIGDVRLDNLPVGKYRKLTKSELKSFGVEI